MTNIDPINPVSSSIAKHLAFALFGLGVFATIVMTLAQVYFDYQKEIALVEERFVNARISHGQSLSASVWNLSARQIEIELQGILNINGIEYAEVRALNGKTWSVGIKNSSDILVDESSLSFRSFGIVQPLGSLVLVAGKKSIYDRITIHAGKTLFFFGFWTFLLSSAVFMIFRQRVTRHLTKIVMYISSISIDTRAQLLVLDRPTNKSEMADELEQLVAGINTMRSQLEVSISNLKQNEERFRLLFENSEVAIWNEDYSEIYEALELLRNDGVIDLRKSVV